MHISELILDGFKSFGRPTKLPFYEDFTVITGPNGSGKSNIIDAVLFALGLARTRGIRAERLPDLIYDPPPEADTDGATREASVTVTLDNSGRTLSPEQIAAAADSEDVGDCDTVQVRRRIKQTEDNYYSYYYLNGRSTTLGAIKDLLAQAGITPAGYNVVMQGDVTEIISMTPYQRRGIIDEIAGVAEFDAKKEAAYEELAAVEDRIDEADLRIEEKTARRDELADEREVALEYQQLREARAEYEGYQRAAELEDKRGELTSTLEQQHAAKGTLETTEEARAEAEAEVSALNAELDALTAEIERKGEDEQLAIAAEIESITTQIARLQERIDGQETAIVDADTDRRKAFIKLDAHEERQEELESQLRETKAAKAGLTAEITTLRGELASVSAEIEAVDTEYADQKEALQAAKQHREVLREKQHAAQREKDRLLDASRRKADAIDEKKEALASVRADREALTTALTDQQAEVDAAAANIETISSVIEELEAQREQLITQRSQLTEQIRDRQSAYTELESSLRDAGQSSWPRSVTTVLQAGLDGVHGTVGQLGQVDAAYATACETAAGGRLANIVVDDDVVGAAGIDLLKQKRAGRATFLPMNKMDHRSLPSPPEHPGVVAFARELVSYEAQYDAVFSYVLGTTLIVEDMDTARSLMGRYRMVTLEGDLVAKSGAMTGGSSGGSRFSFSQTGEGRLERIAAEITDLQADRDAVDADVDAVDADLQGARERAATARGRLQEAERGLQEAEAALEDNALKAETTEAAIANLQAERSSIDADMQEIDATIDDFDGDIEEVSAEITALEETLADSEIPALTSRADAIREQISEAQRAIDGHDNTLNEITLEQRYVSEQIETLQEEIAAVQDRKADAQETIEAAREEIEALEHERSQRKAAVAALEEELADLKQDRSALRSELDEAREEAISAREAHDAATTAYDDLTAEIERLEWEIDSLADEVGSYDPEAIPDHAEVQAEIDRLTEEMTALEPVNMLAIEAYDVIAGELAELRERRDVLEEEAAAITERIEGFEEQKRMAFMTAFDAIGANFTEVFEKLSDGTGELALDEPEAPFEGGLLMRAQPADKPVQRLEGLSGGEKSLAALAFIFAIQRYRPAPFYALDEVDAFLDASNADRVGQMLDDLATDAQFIVVSHRTALLERADRAVGVVMQGNNISSVTGIQVAVDDPPEVTADD
jgi:condensin subunit Smc